MQPQRLEVSNHCGIEEMLDNLCGDLTDRFYWINYGGCAAVALAFYHQLLSIGITPTIIVETEDSDLLQEARANGPAGSAWNEVGFFFDHVYLTFPLSGRHWALDSEGISDTNSNTKESVEITYQELEAAVEADIWNPDFDKAQLPNIYDMIDQSFSALR